MSEQTPFEQWAIVDLFGHQRIAGLVTEQQLGGGSFVRVDVPAVDGDSAFTRLLGQSAIYAISFVSEDVARAAANAFRVKPVSAYEIPALRQLSLSDHVDEDDQIPY